MYAYKGTITFESVEFEYRRACLLQILLGEDEQILNWSK
jgi:hypothetical protein